MLIGGSGLKCLARKLRTANRDKTAATNRYRRRLPYDETVVTRDCSWTVDERGMASDQIAEAERLALEWEAAHPREP